jgi:hypothetical protein
LMTVVGRSIAALSVAAGLSSHRRVVSEVTSQRLSTV